VSPTVASHPAIEAEAAAPSLWRSGAVAGVAAAVATTAVAALAQAIDVPVEIGGEEIPLLGFAQLTLFFTAIGALIAKGARRWSSHARTTFVRVTVALTALSLVPDVTADATTATIVTLMLTHLVAAAIVIPRLADHI
jgi:hypothetical protein